MKIQSTHNQAKAKRYIVVLPNADESTIKQAEEELSVQLVSSAELNDENRAFQIMSSDTGIFYKNLNIAVVDHVPTQRLSTSVANPNSPVLYWEEEREYRIADGFQILQELKSQALNLTNKLEQLEASLDLKDPNTNDETDDTWKNATWGLLASNLTNSKATGKGVKVCVLDTGFYASHPDFSDRVVEGKSFIAGENWDDDRNGHGTHCVGTAAGRHSDDGKRYGVAPDADIYVGKVLSNSGSGSTSGIVDAIDWALEKGCKVISMSLGAPTNVGQSPSLIFERSGERALNNGCIIVAAAGNDSGRPGFMRPVSSPANSKSIMAVAAVDSASNIASFSNAGLNNSTGGRVDICAPGVDVFSCYSKDAAGGVLYKRLNGTSMATPHVAGLAALYWEQFPNASASEIWLKLEKQAKVLNHLQSRDIGVGLAQAI